MECAMTDKERIKQLEERVEQQEYCLFGAMMAIEQLLKGKENCKVGFDFIAKSIKYDLEKFSKSIHSHKKVRLNVRGQKTTTKQP